MRRPLVLLTLLLALVAIPIMSSSSNPFGGVLFAQEAQPADPAPAQAEPQPQPQAQPEMPPASEPRQAQDFPLQGEADIEVNIDEGGAAWYDNPVWIAIGALGLVVLVVLVVMASRGGGTTAAR